MEEMAGLAMSAVDGTLSMVNKAIQEEDDLQKLVKRDLLLITDELEMMRSFLSDSKERVKDNMAGTLVRQVREMSLDVDDYVEYALYWKDRSAVWRRMLPRWHWLPAARPVIYLDNAVENIQLLKARVESLGHRNMRYIHTHESAGKSAEQMHQQALAITTVPHAPLKACDTSGRLGSRVNLVKFINPSQVLGGDGKVEQDKEGTRNDMGFMSIKEEVISVLPTKNDVGLMLLKEAYDDTATSLSFTYRAWVKLVHPFDHREFIHNLLAQFHIISYDDIVEKHKYLIVLEDVSNTADWEAVRAHLPNKSKGSCIIVHTQQPAIAAMVVGNPHRLSELEHTDHPVYLIYKTDKENEATNKANAEKGGAASDDRLKQNSNLVGGDEFFTSLQKSISYLGCEGTVIPVWGIPGVGKSTSVKRVYDKFATKEFKIYGKYKKSWSKRKLDVFQHCGWVDVSYPFNLKDIAWRLLEKLQSGQTSILGISDPIQGCREFIRDNKCLIVIDGLQSTNEWDLIRNAIAFVETESTIIVITNEECVAKYCTIDGTVLNVKCLGVEHARKLFEEKVPSDWKNLMSEEVQKDAYLTFGSKCGGIPKVILAVATYFDFGSYSGELKWRRLHGRFVNELEDNKEELRDLFEWTRSYLHSCPDLLKPCLFYLSVFPVNTKIRRRRLLRRWIAEGYSRDTEETAEEQFRKLSQSGIINHTAWSDYITSTFCEANRFIREYIKSRVMQEDLVLALEGARSMKSKPTGRRHLTIAGTWERNEEEFKDINLYWLRSLTVSGAWRPYFISKDMKVLRVLDLEGTVGVEDGDVEKMVKWLSRLRFLSLRDCSTVKRLPDSSLGGLTLLQTLDISGTSISELPKSIANLKKLEYVRAGTNSPIGSIPPPPPPPPPPAPAAATVKEENTSSITVTESNIPATEAENSSSSLVTESFRPPAVEKEAAAVPPQAAAESSSSVTGTGTSLPPPQAAAVAAESSSSVTGTGTSLSPPQAAAAESSSSVTVKRPAASKVRMPHCCSLLSKLRKSPRPDVHQSHNAGIKMPAVELPDIHTLGIVHVSGSDFTWLPVLTRLRKLGVAGINGGNSPEFFEAISVLVLLESLSVHLDKDNQAGFFDHPKKPPPKSLRRIKLYGLAECKVPAWVNEENLSIIAKLSLHCTKQNGELCFNGDQKFRCSVLDIACDSRLQAVKFALGTSFAKTIDVLKIRCYSVTSSLQLSGLHFLTSLKEVWLSGTYQNKFKTHLEGEIAKVPTPSGDKKVLKLL